MQNYVETDVLKFDNPNWEDVEGELGRGSGASTSSKFGFYVGQPFGTKEAVNKMVQEMAI